MTTRSLPRLGAAVVLAAALIGVGATGALGATTFLGLEGTAVTTETGPTTSTTSAAASTVAASVADDDGDGVRRVVVVGDSLVVGAEDELRGLMEAEGVEVTFLAVSGTGLLTDQAVRTTELADALADLSPDVVVIESCCNYDGGYRLADGTVVATDSELLWRVWEDQARTMTRMAQAAGAEVWWVITPRVLTDTWFDPLATRIERFNEIYRSLGVATIDWDAALYPDGTVEGRESVRAADGLHLTAEGDELVALATWSEIAATVGS